MAGSNFLYKPLWQAVVVIFANLIVLVAARPSQSESMWIIAGACYSFFIIANSVLIWKSTKPWGYFFYSLVVSVAYVLTAWAITSAFGSIAHTKGSNESSMIFLIIMYHPLALLIVMFIKWLITRLIK
jgi:hypothetical protein